MGEIKLVPLGFRSLEEIDDGRQSAAFRKHMARIAQDCMDRPGDSTARVVTLTLSIKPVTGDDGQCESCFVEMEQRSKVPVQRSRPFEMQVTKGGLAFNQEFPDALDQIPLFPNEGATRQE